MYVFEDDTTAIPKESGWFAYTNGTSGEVTHLRNRTIYEEDWIGLKRLDEKGGLIFETTEGGHMQLDDEVLTHVFKAYFGPEKTSWPGAVDQNEEVMEL
jgi:palmitoyl-protein thioesterase